MRLRLHFTLLAALVSLGLGFGGSLHAQTRSSVLDALVARPALGAQRLLRFDAAGLPSLVDANTLVTATPSLEQVRVAGNIALGAIRVGASGNGYATLEPGQSTGFGGLALWDNLGAIKAYVGLGTSFAAGINMVSLGGLRFEFNAKPRVSGTDVMLVGESIDAGQVGTGLLASSVIPNFDAVKLVSGILAVARIPSLPASQITSDVLAPARLASGTPSASTIVRGDGTWGRDPNQASIYAGALINRFTDVLTDDLALQVQLDANSRYRVEGFIVYQAGSGIDFAYTLRDASGSAGTSVTQWTDVSTASFNTNSNLRLLTTPTSAAMATSFVGTVYTNAGNPVTWGVSWSQGTTNAGTPARRLAFSHIRATKLDNL